MELNEFFTTVILTAAVFAALVTSIANIIISLMNNWRLKKIEKQKQMNEIDKYRYQLIQECISDGTLYESADYHNAVFIGKDEGGTPKYAAL